MSDTDEIKLNFEAKIEQLEDGSYWVYVPEEPYLQGTGTTKEEAIKDMESRIAFAVLHDVFFGELMSEAHED
jgi:predicted RNase H-like HicB family nuclease